MTVVMTPDWGDINARCDYADKPMVGGVDNSQDRVR